MEATPSPVPTEKPIVPLPMRFNLTENRRSYLSRKVVVVLLQKENNFHQSEFNILPRPDEDVELKIKYRRPAWLLSTD